MLQLQQQGIERALVQGQNISADLLDAPGDAVAVLRPSTSRVLRTISASVPCKTSGFSFMKGPTFRFPTGRMARFLLESNRKICPIFRRQVQKSFQENCREIVYWGRRSRDFPMKSQTVLVNTGHLTVKPANRIGAQKQQPPKQPLAQNKNGSRFGCLASC
jgi:hypothetical protein